MGATSSLAVMFDLLITGGTVVDGTGTPGVRADVGVTDGRIAAVGELAGAEAAEILDASDRVVCPGFVDPHTHYDAQLFWDPHATPSSQHGITSMVMGNCGFTIAPIGDQTDADYLAAMLVKVEGMSPTALSLGLDWNWRTFGDFLDRFEGNLGVNVAGMVGHSAIRRTVMKDDATSREANPDELEAMKTLLAESLDAGGLGFSTSRSCTHSDGDGAPVPPRTAAADEVEALSTGYGIHIALRAWIRYFQRRRRVPQLRADSLAALGAARKYASPVPAMNHLGGELGLLLEVRDVPEPVSAHIPGPLNAAADYTSRMNAPKVPPIPDCLRGVKVKSLLRSEKGREYLLPTATKRPDLWGATSGSDSDE